jgi:acyl-CoA thioester hydrolase
MVADRGIEMQDNSEPPAPAQRWAHRETVRREWVDYNGHMNVAYYVLVFDHATDAVLDRVGLGEAYRQACNASVFVAEAHVTYEAEVRQGETVAVTSRILGADARRLILYHEMVRETDGALAATNEVLCLHVDLGSRRSAPIPPAIAARIAAVIAEDAATGRPSRAGRAIGLIGRRPG